MHLSNTFAELLPKINRTNFESVALDLFKYQARHNDLYGEFIKARGINWESVTKLSQIPFLPVEFYKDHHIVSGKWQAETYFKSSGTTGSSRSTNYVKSLEFYHNVSRSIFEMNYGGLKNFVLLALLPSYLDQGDSSLISMIDFFINSTGDARSTYISPEKNVKNQIRQVEGKKVLLIGVAYALLDLSELISLKQQNLMVMETGGMKGRKKEMVREELHRMLKGSFNVDKIYSEYGMTELCSQAYGESGSFVCPPWMRILVREVEDPFNLLGHGRTGALNIIDLANIDTCAFLETKDLGQINPDGSFQVLGRMDNSDIRGCNLLMS